MVTISDRHRVHWGLVSATALGGALVFMAQTPRDQAVASFGSYFAGAEKAMPWLFTETANGIAASIGAVLLMGAFAYCVAKLTSSPRTPTFSLKPSAPPTVSELKQQPDKVFPPTVTQSDPAPLPEYMITQGLKALEEMHATMIPPIIAAHAAAAQAVADRRHLLLDVEDGKTRLADAVSGLSDAYRRTKVDRDAVAKRQELYSGFFPKRIFSFPEESRFIDGTRKFQESLQHVNIPHTEGQVGLLEPWAYAYFKDIAQLEAWAKDCGALINIARADLLARMPKGNAASAPWVKHSAFKTTFVEGRDYYHECKAEVVSQYAAKALVIDVTATDLISVSATCPGINQQRHDERPDGLTIRAWHPVQEYDVLINTKGSAVPIVKFSAE